MSGEIDKAFRPPRLGGPLDHFAVIEDPRESPKVRYPLREMLLLALAAAIWIFRGVFL